MHRHLLILDLDETLFYSTESPLERPADFAVAGYNVYKRPDVDMFLATVSSWYDLAVWTSSTADYAAATVARIFPSADMLKFTWARDRCTIRRDFETYQEYWVKDLKKVRRAGFALERVLMIDDSPEKLERQYGNRIVIRSYEGEPDDSELRLLLPFLESLRACENVRTVEKRGWHVWSQKC